MAELDMDEPAVRESILSYLREHQRDLKDRFSLVCIAVIGSVATASVGTGSRFSSTGADCVREIPEILLSVCDPQRSRVCLTRIGPTFSRCLRQSARFSFTPLKSPMPTSFSKTGLSFDATLMKFSRSRRDVRPISEVVGDHFEIVVRNTGS